MNIQLAVSNRWVQWVGWWNLVKCCVFLIFKGKIALDYQIQFKSSNSESQMITVYFSLIIPELVFKVLLWPMCLSEVEKQVLKYKWYSLQGCLEAPTRV